MTEHDGRSGPSGVASERHSQLLSRVVLRNYKSIAQCDVRLGRLTFLVGPNGSGKSNFLDALRFVADSLRRSLDHAVKERGGINEVRRRSGGHPTHFGIRLEFRLPAALTGHYSFEIAAKSAGDYEVQEEECDLANSDEVLSRVFFRVSGGRLESNASLSAAASPDRLYLVAVSGHPSFRPVYDALSHMGFYNLNPAAVREMQPPDPGEVLARDGSNIASVVARLRHDAPQAMEDIERRLERIVPGVKGVGAKSFGNRETLEFRQVVAGRRDPWRFLAESMSDGTLRALGVLVALSQSWRSNGTGVPFVGIEEPETALHPGASGALLGALRTASSRVQIVVTSHSPDLLDDDTIEADMLRAVEAREGTTRIGSLDETTRDALRDRLFTAGELLRSTEMSPDPDEMRRVEQRQLRLFGDG